MPSFEWDDLTVGDVYTAVQARRAELIEYKRGNERAGLKVHASTEPELERLWKVQQQLWDALNGN